MRRFISWVLIFCILHTSTYAAVADLAAQSTPTTPTAYTPTPQNNGHDSHPIIVDPLTPDTATIEVPTAHVKAPNVPSSRRSKHSLGYLKTVTALMIIVPWCAGVATWWSLQPPKVASTDVCFPHDAVDSTAHVQQSQHHYAKGDLPLTEGIQGWLNENAKVMERLGDVVHGWQHGDTDEARDAWTQTKPQVYNALHNHGVNYLGGESIGCDIHLGDGTTPDTVVECRREQPPRSIKSETFKDGVDARLWLYPTRNSYVLLAKNIHLVITPLSESRLYPNPTQSLALEAKHGSRRMLLQTGNTLTLPQAIQTTLNERNDVKQLLAKVAENLRQWNPSTAEITASNTLIKSIFEAHGYIMTGDVQCGFVSENGGLVLADCVLTSTRRADRSFEAEQAGEKVTFKQSLHNPVKFEAVDVETDVLSPDAALPFVLHRAADPLHGELEQLRHDHCSADDRSRVDAVASTVHEALDIPNVNLSHDMACDVVVRNGGIHGVTCNPAEAPDIDQCGSYNGTFAANGRVWVKPDGRVVISANRNWDTTATAELPRTPTVQRPETGTVSHPHSVTLPHTLTPHQTASESLPVVERPVTPANTTTRLYWANWATKPADSSVWVAEVNQTSGGLINPRLFVQGEPVSQPGGLHVDEQHGFIYWGLNSGRGIFAARLQTSPPRVYDNVTLLSTIDTQEVDSLYLEGDTLYWLRGAQLIWGTVDPTNPKAITNVRRPIDNVTTLGLNDLCPLSSPAGLYVNKDKKQLVMSCQGSSREPFMFKFDADGRTITKKQPMSTKMPEVPQSSAFAPELGRVFTRSPGKLYGADMDLDIPAVSGFETLMSNTTMVKYFGGMSVVPNATEWFAPSNITTRLYWSNKDDNNAYMAEINQTSGEAINPRVFIAQLDNPMSLAIDPLNNKIYWASLSGSKVYVGDISSSTTKTQVTNRRTLVGEQVEKIYLDYINKRLFYFPYQANYLYVHYFDIDLLNPVYNGTSRKLYISSAFQFQGSGGIAIDGYNNKFYCRCAYEICVGQIDYSTQSLKDFRKITAMFPTSYPVDLTVDFNNLYIYWRNTQYSIVRAKISTQSTTQLLQPQIVTSSPEDSSYSFQLDGGIAIGY